MIAAVKVPACGGEQMADLPVCVVHHRVEDGHVPQPIEWSVRRARATRSTVASASIHNWHMPGPNGPSRYTVGGTTSHPAASDIR